MKQIIFALSLFLLCASSARSEHYELTLERSIEIAKEQSLDMQSLMQDLKLYEYNLTTAISQMRTKINLNLKLPSYDETIRTRSDDQSAFYSVQQLSNEGIMTIRQPLPTDGSLSLNSRLYTIYDYENNKRSSLFSTGINFDQPLNAIYGYSSIRNQLKSARLNYERSQNNYKRQELALIVNVTGAFYRLLAQQKRLEISKIDLDRQREAYDIAKNKYEAGLLREVEALQMEVELVQAENSYDGSIAGLESSFNSFKNLLGLELDDTISLSSDLSYQVIAVDPDQAVDQALTNRTDIRNYEISIEQQQMEIKAQQVNGLPQGSITAYYAKTGYTDENGGPAAPFESINQSFDSFIERPANYGVGLTVRIPVFDWGENKSRVRAAKTRLKQAEIDQENQKRSIETEVRNTVSNMNASLRQLQAAEKNIVVAEKSFDIMLQRFTDGDIDSQALSINRSQLNSAYSTHLNYFSEYQQAIVTLMQQTMYDYRTNSQVK